MIVQFHITGFGPFQGVEVNPTTKLSNYFSEEKPELQDNACVSSSRVVETSGVASREAVAILSSLARTAEGTEEGNITILLHFGVSRRAECFNLEQFGYNEANFRAADERGWCPQQAKVY
eukprot:TRINITY_DN602_c0_g1_i2.p1 TRINITY_DN602_c0_g1~~TRINITY_DN602_c0_g1_i2.p1  ORF type:complete len:120 (+),score=7.96 TRINITY_DN602_c0_g1_i2:90-449(+)